MIALAERTRRAWAGVRWYLREVSGEGRWDAYVARCAADGVEPVSRREFERHRDHLREHAAAGRCC
ncbi:YbdD/YjiX family protein [Nocardioides sp. ChNu-153]|uniref:YbdD/YjiX family protein n=1 Tax=Nocardioides sp. ChNu-153 TaxID=2779364 RepID=UPI00265A8334|nr:YbdD/YjiX family protein [Nocardioides sp. ChNu-153]